MNHARGVNSAMSKRERSVGPIKATGVGSGVLPTGNGSRSLAGAEGKCPSHESIEPWRPVMLRAFSTLPPWNYVNEAKNFSWSKGVLRLRIR
jgi:hypothetical protein